MQRYCLFIFIAFVSIQSQAQDQPETHVISVGPGWAGNSVNTVIFRKNSLVSFKNLQYIAYYDQEQYVVIGKRELTDTSWQIKRTKYQGSAKDAHNCISIMVDGDGYLHISWDHHGNKLNYCKSIAPGSLELTEKLTMTGINEEKVTYPEFYKLGNGDLLFFYRDGSSGKGNLVLNRYYKSAKEWKQLHTNLIDGESQRNAYWQAFVDTKGTIHLSWVWRESPDVASNHDMCYARSTDGGTNWTNSESRVYKLPITASTAEYICLIPQKSELINQTSMYADESGNPYIVSYWRDAKDSVPQYHLIYKTKKKWAIENLGFRKTSFSLSGTGTRRIPISRPQIIAWKKSGIVNTAVIFRDAERGDKVSIAICKNLNKPKWKILDLYKESVGAWEPTYDTELWKQKKLLHLFIQKTVQINAEGNATVPAEMVKVLESKF